MSTGCTISSITNDYIPFDHCLPHNNIYMDSDNIEINQDYGDNEYLIIDNITIYNGEFSEAAPMDIRRVDITGEQI